MDPKFEELWESYKELAGASDRYGSIIYAPNCDGWTESKLVKKGVPSGYGVYLLYGLRSGFSDELLYVGKAGTVASSGVMLEQGIAGRLTNKAFTANKAGVKESVNRAQLFKYLTNGTPVNKPSINELIKNRYNIEQGEYEKIRIDWIETYGGGNSVPPGVAEATLLWAYLIEFGKLPKMNSEL